MVMVVRDRDDSVTRPEVPVMVTRVLGLNPVVNTAMSGQVHLNDTDIDMLKVTRRQSTKSSRESFELLSMTRRKQRRSVRGYDTRYKRLVSQCLSYLEKFSGCKGTWWMKGNCRLQEKLTWKTG
jgi:hypothetical protein